MGSIRDEILRQINTERERQDAKWGTDDAFGGSMHIAMTVLTEEVGEVARAIQADDIDNIEEELVQVAAVAVRWLEEIHKKCRGKIDE